MIEKSSLIAREASVTNQRIDRYLHKPRQPRLLKNQGVTYLPHETFSSEQGQLLWDEQTSR